MCVVWAWAGAPIRTVAAKTIPITLCRIVVLLPKWIELIDLRAEFIAAP